MNGFDIFVLIVVAVCLVSGFFRGLIREVSGIIGIIAGFYGAATYYPSVMPYVTAWIAKPWLTKLICFFVLFVGVLLFVGLFAFLIRKLLSIIFLGWVDRTFGLVFGFLKGVLICSVVFMVLSLFIPGGSSLVKGSQTAPYLIQVVNVLSELVPGNLRAGMENFF